MSTKIGTVLVFKDGVSKDEAVKILESIKDKLDLHEFSYDIGPCGIKQVPFNMSSMVHEFKSEWGRPVWYVP